MRYATLLLIAALIVGCGPSRAVYEKTTTVSGYDFTEYTEDGFLITPGTYDGDYQSVGVLEVTVYPGLRYEKDNQPVEVVGPHDPPMNWTLVDSVKAQEVVDSLYEEAREMGADAITRFDTQIVTAKTEDMNWYGIQASGFAIRRE